MKRSQAFTALELAVVVVVIVLLLALVMPTFRVPRKSPIFKNGNHLRAIHQSMFIYAQSGNPHMPGLTAAGEPIPDGPATGFSGDGTTGSARLWLLLNGQFISGDLVINPAETRSKWTTGPLTTAHHSYALLSIAGGTAREGRRAEWRDTVNSQAILISDRNTGQSATDSQVRSLWTTVAGDWKGSVVWGDNHAEFAQQQHGFATRYHKSSSSNDNLFADGPTPGVTETDTTPGANAFLLWD